MGLDKAEFMDASAEGARILGIELPKAPQNGKGPHSSTLEGLSIEQRVQSQGLTHVLATEILRVDRFAQDGGARLYVYQQGVYRPGGEEHAAKRVKQLLGEWQITDRWSAHRASEVIAYIKADCAKLWEAPPMDRVNLLNGILNVDSLLLSPHTPEFLSPIQLPVNYDPDADCPRWREFVLKSFPEDAPDLAAEIAAYLISPGVGKKKAVILLGERDNGKSVYLRALMRFAGQENVSTMTLQELETNRFASGELFGKLANICADLPSTHLESTSVFKRITGGDAITGEHKHGTFFSFRPFAKLIFSANHPPRSEDATSAFFERWLVVPFNRTFKPDDPDFVRAEVLDESLSDEGELSGVLNMALGVLPKLREEGFTESPSMKEAWNEFREMTDPLSVWLERETRQAPDGFVPKSQLCTAYNAACEAAGRPMLSSKAFTAALLGLKPHLQSAQRVVGTNPKALVWLGIDLKEK